MNELIKELRNLAWEEIYGVDLDDPRVARAYAHMEEGMAKFAELIVKDLVDKCKNDWYGDSLDSICDQMLKHYGVEE